MLLYFTTQKRISKDQVNKWLPGRFDNIVKREVGTGPGGVAGQVFCSDSSRCRYDAKSQTWKQIGDELWVGWDKAKPPTPESLQRDSMIPGHVVELAGQRWMIPMVREWNFRSESASILYSIVLAKSAQYDAETKTWTAGDVVEKQKRMFELAQDIYERYCKRSEDDVSFDLPENPLDVCAEFLAVNYRIGPEEISVLGLLNFDFDSAWSVLRLVIDEPGLIEAHQKKMAYDALSPSDG